MTIGVWRSRSRSCRSLFMLSIFGFNSTETEMFKFNGLTFGHRWTFYQLDDSFSSAFEAKVSNISILGTKSGAARNCTACPPGYHSTTDNTDCKICPNGTSSLAGSDKCAPCQGQTFAAQVYSFTFDTRVSEGSVTHTWSFVVMASKK